MIEKLDKEISCGLCGSNGHSSNTHLARRDEFIKRINKNPENISEARERGPATLDIIKLDNCWAQSENFTHAGLIKWLDTGVFEIVDPETYELIELYDVPLTELTDSFTFSEIENVHWGPEQDDHIHLK